MNIFKKMCGAKTRQGTPCKNTRIYKNGRCKNHGGLSTGPRTEEGKAKALANLKKTKKRMSFYISTKSCIKSFLSEINRRIA